MAKKKTGEKPQGKEVPVTEFPGAIHKTAMSNTMLTPSLFYSPEVTQDSWVLPKSFVEQIRWIRIFFNLEPYVRAITEFHAYYPFSKFDLTTSDPQVTQFYKQVAFNDNFNLFAFIRRAALQYSKYGESLMFGTPGEDSKGRTIWETFVLLEPELVEVSSDVITGKLTYEMIPPPELKNMVMSPSGEDEKKLRFIEEKSPEIIAAIKAGRNIKLDDDCVSMVANYTDASATRGSSPIVPLMKSLILQDWIRLAQTAYAQKYVFPVEIWTIGDLANNVIPDQNAINNFRSLIADATLKPPFSVFVPPYVKYDVASTQGRTFDLGGYYDYIQDQLLVGLGVNRNIIQGDGPSFGSSKMVSLHALIQKYKDTRAMFEDWMLNKFFRPLAIENGFFEVKNGERIPILPEIIWYKSLEVEEQEAERDHFMDLHAKGLISTETLFTKFQNLDYKTEQKKLEEERGTVFDKNDSRIPSSIAKPITTSDSFGTPSSIDATTPKALSFPVSTEPPAPVEPGAADDTTPEEIL